MLLRKVPPGLRARSARYLPEGVLGPAWRGPAYWAELYGSAYDPYGFETSPEEHLKFTRTLELCGRGPFRSALEIGCSVGTFTELLAPRCQSLLAVDVSSAAVERASRRMSALPYVHAETRDVTIDWPAGEFDLIVASDVLYYWTPDAIVNVLRRMEASLSPGGLLLLMHFVPWMSALLNGDEVHDLVTSEARLEHTLSAREEFGAGRTYRIDIFRRTG